MATFRRNLAIDLGTASVLVYVRGKGVVLNEPSVVAMDTFTNQVLAVGSDAKKMLGRTPGNVMAKRPMRDGVIADFQATEQMIRYFMHKAVGRSFITPDLIICVPSQISQVQRRAVLQASKQAGANKTYLIEEPLAAAIGAGVDIADPRGSMVIDIGGGTTDVAVIALGGLVVSESIKTAGDELDDAIAEYIRKHYQMMIGERTAEELKIRIGRALPEEDEEFMEVKGRNLINGLPVKETVSSNEMAEAMKKPLKEIIDTVHRVLEKTPPELAADLYDRGAILTGGGSMITGLSEAIRERIGIDVTLTENPITSVVRGTGKALQWIDMLKANETKTFGAQRKLFEEQQALRRR
ncbi:MAG: rod shape-determining protein [Tissierellia bacterium]|nr:rod shape-determining protein [Bacillota bacterium]NLK58976.1 rod shape-determining protein [Tissierellia bacterium]